MVQSPVRRAFGQEAVPLSVSWLGCGWISKVDSLAPPRRRAPRTWKLCGARSGGRGAREGGRHGLQGAEGVPWAQLGVFLGGGEAPNRTNAPDPRPPGQHRASHSRRPTVRPPACTLVSTSLPSLPATGAPRLVQ
eukprot:s1674_g1.t1